LPTTRPPLTTADGSEAREGEGAKYGTQICRTLRALCRVVIRQDKILIVVRSFN